MCPLKCLSAVVFLCVFVIAYVTTSNLTDGEFHREDEKDHTNLDNVFKSLSVDVLRQLVNQESLMRLAMSKNVQSLINSVKKFNVTNAEKTMELHNMKTEFKKEVTAINAAINFLKMEDVTLNDNLSDHHNQMSVLRSTLWKVLNDSVDFVEILNKDFKEFKSKTSKVLQDLKVEVRYLSMTLFDLKKFDGKFLQYINESIQNVNSVFNETKEEQVKLASRIESLEEAQKNASTAPGYTDARDCYEILKDNKNLRNHNGIYFINVGTTNLRSVFCDMSTDGGGWTVIQRRQDSETKFDRDWNDYKNGFGNLKKEHWLGNDIIHLLTKNKNQVLRVELERFSGEKAYAEYSQFYINDENDKYKLSISGYSGSAGDAMNYNDGHFFTTKDRDNDNSGRNAAEKHGGGWWYDNTSWATLNGKYRSSAVNSQLAILWYQWGNKWEALKSTTMMIRKKT